MKAMMLVIVVGSMCSLGCGSGSGGDGSGGSGSGGSGFGCSVSSGGYQYCYSYSNLSEQQASAARSACSSGGGKVVDSCPTDGLVGCCSTSGGGIAYQNCHYFGTAADGEAMCPGTWTSGKAGLGGGSTSTGTSTSTNTSTSTTTCRTSDKGICCPEGYCTLGSAHGYLFPYSDRSSLAGLTASDRLCVTGYAEGILCGDQGCYSEHWGAGIGVNLNQARGESSTPMSYTSASSAGVTYALDNMAPNMRLVVGDSKTDYCASLTSSSGTIPWSSFSSSCWNSSGSHLSGPPSSFTSVRFQVVADTNYGDTTYMNFCVTKLSL